MQCVFVDASPSRVVEHWRRKERKLNTPSTIWWLSWYRCQAFCPSCRKNGAAAGAQFQKRERDGSAITSVKGKESRHRCRKGSEPQLRHIWREFSKPFASESSAYIDKVLTFVLGWLWRSTFSRNRLNREEFQDLCSCAPSPPPSPLRPNSFPFGFLYFGNKGIFTLEVHFFTQSKNVLIHIYLYIKRENRNKKLVFTDASLYWYCYRTLRTKMKRISSAD